MTGKRPPRRQLANDPDQRMNNAVAACDGWFPERDFQKLDRRNLDFWIADLTRGEASVRRLRKRLEAIRDSTEKACPSCGRSFAGRADAIYCDSACRIRAHREAKRATAGPVTPREGAADCAAPEGCQ